MSFGKFFNDSAEDNKTQTASAPSYAPPQRAALETVIGNGSKIVGRLDFREAAELNGEIEGDITSKSRLIVGEQCKVRGTIDGVEVVIQGVLEGDVRASKRLILRKPARIKGNIFAASLSVEEGVSFEGSCAMPKEALAQQDLVSKPQERLTSGISRAQNQTGIPQKLQNAGKQTVVAA